jgi:hypothetical protein
MLWHAVSYIILVFYFEWWHVYYTWWSSPDVMIYADRFAWIICWRRRCSDCVVFTRPDGLLSPDPQACLSNIDPVFLLRARTKFPASGGVLQATNPTSTAINSNICIMFVYKSWFATKYFGKIKIWNFLAVNTLTPYFETRKSKATYICNPFNNNIVYHFLLVESSFQNWYFSCKLYFVIVLFFTEETGQRKHYRDWTVVWKLKKSKFDSRQGMGYLSSAQSSKWLWVPSASHPKS